MTVFFAVLLALCVVVPAGAQVHLGALGGLHMTEFNVDPADGGIFPNGLPFGFGGVVDYELSKHTALHLEPMYLRKFPQISEGAPNFRKVKFQLTYLEVPVMLKYAFGTNHSRPYVMAGPTIGFNLSSSAGFREVGILNSISESWTDMNTKLVDFGLGFGAGVSVMRSNHSILVEARYAFGLTNISNDPNDSYGDLKSRGLQVFTGLTFPLRSK
jgi:hypothetical protein